MIDKHCDIAVGVTEVNHKPNEKMIEHKDKIGEVNHKPTEKMINTLKLVTYMKNQFKL